MNKLFRFLLIFSVSYLVLILILPKPEKLPENQILIEVENQFLIGELVEVKVSNTTKQKITFKDYCPNLPLKVESLLSGEVKDLTNSVKTTKCSAFSVESGSTAVFSFHENNLTLFSQTGNYKVTLDTLDGKHFEKSFEITGKGFFSKIWDGLFYKPIYNLLIALIEYGPAHSLAFGIILLTILVKIVLLLPNHKALKNQKEMQKIQPELTKIKEKYKGDQQKMAQETMAIWKKHKVNPLGSCLPLLLQFPFLIAIFFIIKDGLTPNNAYLLYSPLANFDYSLISTTVFSIFDLKNSGNFFLAALVGATQFLQMHFTFKSQPKVEGTDFMAMQMQMMGKMMKYVMPGLVAIFTFKMPSGVGLYWFISTLFGLFQQLVINKMYNKPDDSDKKGKGKKSKEKDFIEAEIVEPKKGEERKEGGVTKIRI